MNVAAAARELTQLKASLAATTEALSGPRMRWRAIRDAIARECYTLDCDSQNLVRWAPMGRHNIDLLNTERSAFREAARDLEAQERILKEAVRKAEIDLKAAEAEQQKTAQIRPAHVPVSPPKPSQMSLF